MASEPSDRTPVHADQPRPDRSYTERLSVPWWMWPAGLLAAALVATEIWMGAGGVRAWLPFTLLPPVALALLWRLGRIRISVTDTEFLVDDARLPHAVVADVVALDAAGRREALGVGAHPWAFVVQRPWIGGAVQVLLDDPADSTPYWIVSTRHPVRLATALLAARQSGQRSSGLLDDAGVAQVLTDPVAE